MRVITTQTSQDIPTEMEKQSGSFKKSCSGLNVSRVGPKPARKEEAARVFSAAEDPLLPCSTQTSICQAQVPAFCLLSVRIIRMRNVRKADLLSQNDCYVSLRLPTASFTDVRTKTISNCSNPVWNETFYFRIQNVVKNVLELKVCDEDTFRDDQLYTVLFDIANLQPGETVCRNFELNEQKDELLEVEFTLEYMPDMPECLTTNGVLVSRELSCLKVEVAGRQKRKTHRKRSFTFNVAGSDEESQEILLDSHSRHLPPNFAVFHYVKHCNPELEVILPKKRSSICSPSDKGIKDSLILPLNQLPMEGRVGIANDKAYEIFATTGNCQKDLDMRLGFGICPEEQEFICKRKRYVAAALKQVLHLEEDLQEDEIPVVAAMTTAGGIRSMTAFYGSLLGLQKLNLLDCFSYITGLSGTTWTMIKLYEDARWSQNDLEGLISDARRQVMKNKLSCFSLEHLKYYEKEIWQRHLEGHKLSFTDFWGLVLESMLHDEPDPNKLSDQRKAVNLGQNPLPIYLALHVREKYSTLDFKEWVEFTPYEVGFLKYGAFINAEDFGSEFFMGRLMKKIPESRLCFLQGMWSNIFSLNMLDALYLADCSEDFWHRWTRDRMVDIEDDNPYTLPKRPYVESTRLFIPSGTLTDLLRDVVTLRPVVSQYHNFMRGLQMNNKYLENARFCIWKDTVLDSSPNQLRDTAEYLELLDTAFFINTSCPPLLRPERKVDVILHLNYSGGSQTLPLDLSEKYYEEQGIPFPKAVLTKEDREHLKECYLFDQAESPRAPILLYFPLVCDTFQKYKAPGVERSPSEMEAGQADVNSTIFSPYATGMLQYSEENFNKLLNLTSYNILNNEHLIHRALHIAIERKKQKKRECLFPGS
ncbi:cytosolic phospholipase A2 epsilon-like [Hemicordylus capensis]|uniref:cytosolic phospholipase A2 epsilon-like n=1 Tax=Hemicordylus capensis TaxID=884348 RepID=UPI00230359AA|nr:cytosolic phospholipase A2 epsilon-like [Hemicordylus capensis]